MSRGWTSLPEVPPTGDYWPLAFAAGLLGIPETALRRQVKKAGLEPAGTISMAAYRRSGRQPAAYDAEALIALSEQLRAA